MTKVNNNSRSSSSSSDNQPYKRIKLDDTNLENNNNKTTMKTQAAFVNKLYKMLEDPQTSDLISWSSHGDLFSVSNPTLFSKCVLPQYFKHNNWQSFVRQLNMYGFHKVNDLIHSNLTNENQTWEFKHPNFRRGAVGDLQHIKRKSAKTQLQQLQQQRQQELQELSKNKDDFLTRSSSPPHLQPTPPEHHELDDQVSRIESHLVGVSKSCELLYNEIVHLRMIVSKQQVVIQDLVDVVSTSKLNSNCTCSTNSSMGPHGDPSSRKTASQDLQDAESLRLQIAKIKEIQSIHRPTDHHERSSSSSSSSSSSLTPNRMMRYDSADLKTYSIDSPSFHPRKLPLIETMQPLDDLYDPKSCHPPRSTDSSKISERNHASSIMSFGKESHMLNPIGDSGKRKKDLRGKQKSLA
ncbi:hypothetical protein G6F46_011037 [Rhizopus delemar]|uniref:HSF-type DNA-binding domain-containing protein n=2 Tax=Rhizopus TaxID=4842 RepID=A0A9P6YAH6_RHIOR|nr:hypothetical protein G6F51_007135 [Rhizopus arrhizus]KAG1579088.1 hypothetical protein G6F48_011429 [Rhizopus delemar]KAG1609117.1 hypothetical protein G6F46_011037 [Rhizopus delemar]KAG1635669.1 hypothetical protein G6F45_001849 [Rhizopus arrhizus]